MKKLVPALALLFLVLGSCSSSKSVSTASTNPTANEELYNKTIT